MPLRDTSPEAEAVQLRILRSMTGEQRVQIAFDLTTLTQEFARAGIRADHPEWSESQITRELLRRAFLPNPMPRGF
ncbi:MAG TPA: hypothetical protein VFO39_00910 [Candidatus Sulfotelmatobacter sp.]|nr:hypothetical protein [Candidatus Sulfotelmatobacter sp.]